MAAVPLAARKTGRAQHLQAENKERTMTERAAPTQVLVVDDSAVSRKLLEHALENPAYTVRFAKDGAEALRAFDEHAPALVITDWVLPDVSGPELCQQLRARAKGYTYIVIVTSNSAKEQLVEGLAAGADDYLTKPFDPGELQARIGVGRRTVELHREIAEKNRQLEELALTDHLTGLPNRRAVEQFAKRQLRGAIRYKFSLWVILPDLDSFKQVNDEFGHAAGDEVLRRFAEILKAKTRASDICGRLGGDEFVLVLSHARKEDTARVAERLREEFACQKFQFGGKNVRVTASFGIAGFQGTGAPELRQLFDRADRALYEGKQTGRNQVKTE
jgi:two-component system cell cycle response regulator